MDEKIETLISSLAKAEQSYARKWLEHYEEYKNITAVTMATNADTEGLLVGILKRQFEYLKAQGYEEDHKDPSDTKGPKH